MTDIEKGGKAPGGAPVTTPRSQAAPPPPPTCDYVRGQCYVCGQPLERGQRMCAHDGGES